MVQGILWSNHNYMNLPENIFFQISEMWTILAFSIIFRPFSVLLYFLKVHCVVSSEEGQCYSLSFPLKRVKFI